MAVQHTQPQAKWEPRIYQGLMHRKLMVSLRSSKKHLRVSYWACHCCSDCQPFKCKRRLIVARQGPCIQSATLLCTLRRHLANNLR